MPEYTPNNLLRDARTKKGWSQKYVVLCIGEKLGKEVYEATLSHWERGVSCPSFDYLNALCEVFRKEPEQLGYRLDAKKVERTEQQPGCDECNEDAARPDEATVQASAAVVNNTTYNSTTYTSTIDNSTTVNTPLVIFTGNGERTDTGFNRVPKDSPFGDDDRASNLDDLDDLDAPPRESARAAPAEVHHRDKSIKDFGTANGLVAGVCLNLLTEVILKRFGLIPPGEAFAVLLYIFLGLLAGVVIGRGIAGIIANSGILTLRRGLRIDRSIFSPYMLIACGLVVATVASALLEVHHMILTSAETIMLAGSAGIGVITFMVVDIVLWPSEYGVHHWK